MMHSALVLLRRLAIATFVLSLGCGGSQDVPASTKDAAQLMTSCMQRLDEAACKNACATGATEVCRDYATEVANKAFSAAWRDFKASAKWGVDKLVSLCREGDMESCATVGNMLMPGYSYKPSTEISPDPAVGAELLQLACSGDQPAACETLAKHFAKGNGVPKDRERSAKLYEQACNAKVHDACVYFADRLLWGDGVVKDEARAVGLFRDACQLDQASPQGPACVQVGKAYLDGRGVSPDIHASVPYLLRGCEPWGFFGGFVEACDRLGELIEQKKLSTADLAEVTTRMKADCEKKEVVHAESCVIYGETLLATNPTEATRIWGIAISRHEEVCAQAEADEKWRSEKRIDHLMAGTSSAEYCTALAHMRRTGKGAPKDPAAAAKLYERGCQWGSARGCFGYGMMLRDGNGIPQDRAKADQMFKRACDQDVRDGCAQMAAKR